MSNPSAGHYRVDAFISEMGVVEDLYSPRLL
jgi:hypothetical protein